MKKLIPTLMILAMMLTAAACGSAEVPTAPETTTAAQQPQTLPERTTAAEPESTEDPASTDPESTSNIRVSFLA